jgi:hypothetical protein
MAPLIALLGRAVMVAGTCYLISQGNLTAAALIIGFYWILFELIQAKLLDLIFILGIALPALYRRTRR